MQPRRRYRGGLRVVDAGGGLSVATGCDGAGTKWKWPGRLRARRAVTKLSVSEQAERAQRIDFLSVALASLPSENSSRSDWSRRSRASSAPVHASHVGLEELQDVLRHARVRPWGVALLHALTVWCATSGFVASPAVTRDLMFAWFAWTLILALKPEVRSSPP
jgi:hypothetical protein